MNASTTTSRVRIQPHGSSAMLRANGLASASLAGLERQRSCRNEAEPDWLLKQHGVAPRVSASRVAMLRADDRRGTGARRRTPCGHPWEWRRTRNDPCRGDARDGPLTCHKATANCLTTPSRKNCCAPRFRPGSPIPGPMARHA